MENKELTELEKRQAELAKKFESGNLSGTTDGNDAHAKRERMVKNWVQDYFTTMKYVNQAKEDGKKFTTQQELVDYIVAELEGNAEEKDNAVSALFA